ncbi:protein-tyrosine phosphatase family protein [Paenibacillus lignilyticus]|uniref:Dual specificity protein phosphatase family protein n=1 Tax=Paenibacillus lignilyticus TaxID=1172615 RepID=A0ABS5C703_9BACL|nr:dual specificity protein phosphatase family protein [Paenibacillus lignilyticus]MBP3961778.1 dual specificity protein phosphatase family protein [Paenibacillus lignilyticus]MBP3963551.1 dual specificity protein phosphatase family protein [Paenibacillus lignilyticus]
MSQNNYQALIKDRIFMGGAADVEDMIKNEEVDVVIDLRAEAAGCAYEGADVEWIQIPLGDNKADDHLLFKKAIDEVVGAYKSGKKVAFHCAGGGGRTGVVAVGTLIELSQAAGIEEAEAKAIDIRAKINIKPPQREALDKLYRI